MIAFLSATEFAERWRDVHASVFSGDRIDESPFTHAAWESTLIAGGLAPFAEDFAGIAAIAREEGDSQCFVLDPRWSFASRAACEVALAREEFLMAHTESPLGHVEVHVAARSGRWGLVAHPEGVAVLSAPSLESFFAAAGGRESVRQRFEAEAPAIGHGAPGVTFRARLRSLVGWEAA